MISSKAEFSVKACTETILTVLTITCQVVDGLDQSTRRTLMRAQTGRWCILAQKEGKIRFTPTRMRQWVGCILNRRGQVLVASTNGPLDKRVLGKKEGVRGPLGAKVW